MRKAAYVAFLIIYTMFAVFLLIYIGFAVLVAMYSKKTYLGFVGGFLLSLIITPLITALILQLFKVVKTLD